jgi:hypothetical protein
MLFFQWQKFWGRGGGATKISPSFIFFSFKCPDINFVGGALQNVPPILLFKKIKKKWLFNDYVLALREQFCWGGGGAKSPSHFTSFENKKKKMIQVYCCFKSPGVTILWGQPLKIYFQLYFSENWKNMIFILIVFRP